MQDASKQISLGPSNLVFNGENLGHSDENGLKVTFKNSFVRGKANKYGTAPVNILLEGQEVMVEGVLIQTIMDNASTPILDFFVPGANSAAGATNTKFTFGQTSGQPLPTGVLTIKPELTVGGVAYTPVFDFTLTKAAAVGEPVLLYTGNKYQAWAVKFEGIIDESQADGAYLATFGDASINVASGAPTASLTTPSGTTGVSTATSIVWTFSKALRGLTVNANSVLLYRASTGALVACSTPILTNNGASTTVSMTPNSALAGSSVQYIAVLTGDITDQAGTPLVAKAVSFTTA